MIGIYGGTFDPVHYGHLRTALEVKELLHLDEVRLLPCAQPPHRERPLASSEQRLQMLRLALADEQSLVIDTRELRRKGPSYMIETLKSLREELAATPLLLFIGSDAFKQLTAWREWRALFNYAHVVVMRRPGGHDSFAGMDAYLKQRITETSGALSHNSHGCLYFLEVTQLDISASQIRRALAEQHSPRYLLPDSVLQYIKYNRLYVDL